MKRDIVEGIAETGKKARESNAYSYWGKLAENAIGEGWKPVEEGKDYTVYRNPYKNAMDNIVLPNQKGYGHIAIIGKRGGKFDIAIRNLKGETVEFVGKDMSPEDVDKYSKSFVGARTASIDTGRNADKTVNGKYTAVN
jgi:hypothetical protein